MSRLIFEVEGDQKAIEEALSELRLSGKISAVLAYRYMNNAPDNSIVESWAESARITNQHFADLVTKSVKEDEHHSQT